MVYTVWTKVYEVGNAVTQYLYSGLQQNDNDVLKYFVKLHFLCKN